MVVWTVLTVSPQSDAQYRSDQIEKKMLKAIMSEPFERFAADFQCSEESIYRVVLIDNFDQAISIIPEVKTTHGEMVKTLLQSGRRDIQIQSMNTALSKGLAMVIEQVMDGHCLDLVVSSTPGSNYTYEQISSLLGPGTVLNENNILAFKSDIQQLIHQIATQGFPSVAWLQAADINSIKLKNDALKYVFIQALGRLNIPVILPYGNQDTRYKGRNKSLNLLSFADNAMVYSGLDQYGRKLPDFPYSPVSSGSAQAVYPIVECPIKEKPHMARIDINDDGYWDYTFQRQQGIPYKDASGVLRMAPLAITDDDFERRFGNKNEMRRLADFERVFTRSQFKILQQEIKDLSVYPVTKAYVWIHSKSQGPFFEFDAVCRPRGVLQGTSVIPPHKAKEWLTPLD